MARRGKECWGFDALCISIAWEWGRTAGRSFMSMHLQARASGVAVSHLNSCSIWTGLRVKVVSIVQEIARSGLQLLY